MSQRRNQAAAFLRREANKDKNPQATPKRRRKGKILGGMQRKKMGIDKRGDDIAAKAARENAVYDKKTGGAKVISSTSGESEFRMSFGKHKGKILADVPDDYLQWLLGRDHWAATRIAVERHLKLKSSPWLAFPVTSGSPAPSTDNLSVAAVSAPFEPGSFLYTSGS